MLAELGEELTDQQKLNKWINTNPDPKIDIGIRKDTTPVKKLVTMVNNAREFDEDTQLHEL